jgi:RNase H-like domain found in reverse transcriptase
VICDACPSGVAGVLGQGQSWDRVKIAGLWSARLTTAQSNYPTHQQELLAIVGALDKFEDQLLGRRFTVVTDHRSLVYLSSQDNLSPRQVRWWEFLSRFNFRITYVKGSLNIVADALSRKFEGLPAGQPSPPEDYLSVDKRLDPDGDELPGSAPVGGNRDSSVVSVPEGQMATVTTRSLTAPSESR